MNPAVTHVENQGDVHIAVTGVLQHPVKLLPVRHVEAVVVESGMKRIVGGLCLPGCNESCPGRPVHDRLTEVSGSLAAGNGDAQPVDLQPMETIEAVLNGVVVTKAYEPVCRGSVEEKMLSSSLPDEVPWVSGIDTEQAALFRFNGAECSA